MLAAIGRSIEVQQEVTDALKAKAEELMRKDGTTQCLFISNSATNLLITFNPVRRDQETTYHVHQLRWETFLDPPAGFPLVSGIWEDNTSHVSYSSTSYDVILRTILADKIGSPVTIMNRSCGEIEVMQGTYIPQTDLSARSFWSVKLETKGQGSFSARIEPLAYADSGYGKSVAMMNNTAKRLRSSGPDILGKALQPHISRSMLEAVRETAKATAERFRIDLQPRERMPYRGHALDGNYIEVSCGLQESVWPVALHEFIHQLIPNRNSYFRGDRFANVSRPVCGAFLHEGLTDFVKRLALASDASISERGRFAAYYSTDILYVLCELHIIAIEDIVWTLISDDPAILMKKLETALGKGAEKIFDHSMNYESDGNEEELWFASAIAQLEKKGIRRADIEAALKKGIDAKMVPPDILQAAKGIRPDRCPEFNTLF